MSTVAQHNPKRIALIFLICFILFMFLSFFMLIVVDGLFWVLVVVVFQLYVVNYFNEQVRNATALYVAWLPQSWLDLHPKNTS